MKKMETLAFALLLLISAAFAGTISGTITNAVGGAPVAGAVVSLIDANTGAVVAASPPSDALGAYALVLGAYNPGNLTVTAAGFTKFENQPGYVNLNYDGNNFPGINFALTPSQAPAIINGTVRDTNNNALSGVTVSVASPSGSGTNTTDVAGAYSLGNLTAGTYNVTASKTGYLSQTTTGITVLAGGAQSVNFSLTQLSLTVSGTVRDASSGAAISGATVTVSTASFGASNTTNAAGNYIIYSLAPGTYNVTLSSSGYTTPIGGSTTFNLAAANLTGNDYTMTAVPAAPPSGGTSGTGGTGVGVGGGGVGGFGIIRAGEEAAEPAEPEPVAPPTPAPAPVATSVQAPDSATTGTSVSIGAVDASGQPVANAIIEVIMPNQQKFSVVTDANGKADIYLDYEGVYTFALPQSDTQAAGSLQVNKAQPTGRSTTTTPTTPSTTFTVNTGATAGTTGLLGADIGGMLNSTLTTITSNKKIFLPIIAVIGIAAMGAAALVAKGLFFKGKPPAPKAKNGVAKLEESIKSDRSIVEKWKKAKGPKLGGKAG